MPSRLSTSLEAVYVLDRAMLGKARLPSILTESGFLRSILREARALIAHVGGKVRDILPRVRKSANIDWPKSTATQRDTAVEEMAKLVEGLPSQFLPGVRFTMKEQGRIVAQDTRSALRRKHKKIGEINPSISLEDRRAVDAIGQTTSMFFAPQYESRAKQFTSRAQRTIAEGLGQGLGRREIARELTKEFVGTGIAESYWETAAAVHVSRARSFSQAASMVEAGFTDYQILAVQDERTTDICRFMDGQIFTLGPAINAFDNFEDAKNLDEAKKVMPFMTQRGDGLFLPGDRRVATIEGGGGFRDGLSSKQLSSAGISTPPFHFRCRSTIIPI